MIRGFACPETERLFNDEASRRLPTQIQRVARRKLLLLNQARPARQSARSLERRPGGRAQHPYQ
jgi:plasmid maintenance system killer protein